jgi:hypothetical protein
MRHDAALVVIPAQVRMHDFLDSRLRGNDKSPDAIERQFA